MLAAVRTMNRLELVGETVRCALNRLAAVAPVWLRAQIEPVWLERYAVRVENYRLPKAAAAREALAAAIGADGVRLLRAACAPQTPAAARGEPALEVLRQIWVQQYYAPDETGTVRLRSAKDVPPPERWIVSPYDRDARFSVKRGVEWVGYKGHLTEACDADRPELITHVATTRATTQDDAVTGAIHDDLAARRLLPADHLVDAGYTSAEHLVRSRAAHGIDLVGPVAANASWQERAGTGFDLQRFAIEWDTQTVICPQGKRSRSWRPRHHPGGLPQIHVRFDRHDCLACVCRAACTRSTTKPRTLAFQPQAHQVALEAARLRQTTPEFK